MHWAVLAFLLGFAALLCLLIWYYLIPAGQAARAAAPPDRARLRAVSLLLLAVVLFILFIGLLLVLRSSHLFPRPSPKPTKTDYVDAWSESAKRIQVPPPDDAPRED